MATKTKERVEPITSVMNANIVALMKGKVFIPSNDGADNAAIVSTVQAHLMQYGYMLSKEAFEQLSRCDSDTIIVYHEQVIEYLKNAMGGRTAPKPLYKNFPEEVMSKSDCELYFNALLYYWTESAWRPLSIEMERPVAFENIKYTVLSPVDTKGLDKIFTDLVCINTSLTPQDLDIVKWFAGRGKPLDDIMPESIPFKENLMTLAGMGIPVPVKTPTDVLRIAVHMSGGDVSLPAVPPKMVKERWRGLVVNTEREKFKFRNFTRAERRYLLGLLEQTHCSPAEMVLKDGRWIRLGEILHPGEYKAKFPRTYKAFEAIRNTKVRSWYSKLTKVLYKDKNLAEGLRILLDRPGEFMRRVDWLFRTFTGKKDVPMILEALEDALDKSSNKVLFETLAHFEGRNVPKTGRTIMVKGARKKTPLPDLPALSDEVVTNIQLSVYEGLKRKFSKLETLGDVWIDEELKKIPIPTNMRSLNKGLRPTVRGSRIPWDNPKAKVIRAFVHWKGPVDLDLSANFVGTKKLQTLNYHGLKVGESCHSGDVRHQQGPCAEYVDIVVEDAIHNGFQYVLVDLRNFDGGSLKKHEAVFGLMEREHPQSNKIWLPETISNAQELEASGGATMIGIIDLATKEYISLDIDGEGINASHDLKSVLLMIDEYAKPPKFSVHDLLVMHAETRGNIVTDRRDADTVFEFRDFIASYEQTAKYML